MNLIAAQIKNSGTDGTTTLIAGNNLNLGTVTESRSNTIKWDADNRRNDASRSDVGTTIKSAGNLALNAGNDINAKAATLTSDKGAVAVNAGRDVNLTAGESATSYDESHRVSGRSGFLSKKTTTTRDAQSQTSAVGSTLSGDTIQIVAGRSIDAQAVGIAGSNDVTLQAGKDITLRAGNHSTSESHLIEVKKSGFSASLSGLSFSKSSAKDTFDTQAANAAASTLGSVDGNLTLKAGQGLRVTGSDLMAGKDITLSAQEVRIEGAAETSHTVETHTRQQSSIGIAAVGTMLDSYRNMKDAAKTEGGFNKFNRMSQEAGAQAFTAPQVAMTFGRSSSSSTTVTDTLSTRGSSLTAGGNLRIDASGTGLKDANGKAADGGIRVSGSSLNASGDATLVAQRNIELSTATNQSRQTTTGTNSASSFSTAAVTPGDAMRNIAGSANNSGVKAFPYSKSKATDKLDGRSSTQTGSQLNANNVALIAQQGDVAIRGSNVSATHNIDVRADQGEIRIVSGQNAQSHDEQHDSKSIGDLGSNGTATSTGTSNSVGVRKIQNTLASDTTDQNSIRSRLVAGDDLTLKAKQDITVQGADLSAGRNLTAVGRNITIDPGVDSSRTQQSSQMHQAGVTAAIGGYAVEAIKSAEAANNARKGVDSSGEQQDSRRDARLSTLYAAQSALAAYNGIQSHMPETKGPTANGASNSGNSPFKVTVSLGTNSSSSNARSEATQVSGSTLIAGSAVSLEAVGSGIKDSTGKAADGNIIATGAQVKSTDVKLVAANDIVLRSAGATNIFDSHDSSSAASIGVGFAFGGQQNGFTLELAASRSQGQSNGNTSTNRNTSIEADRLLTIKSGNDTTLAGAVATAEQVVAEIGGNLSLVSIQDLDIYKSKSTSGGVSVSLCVPPLCYGASSAGASVFAARADGNFASVVEQSGIAAGDGGFQIKVRGNTGLAGATISSSRYAELTNANLLRTGTLTFSDIANSSSANAASAGGGISSDIASQGKYGITKTALGTLMTAGKQSGDSSGYSKSAISVAQISIVDEEKQQVLTGEGSEATIAALSRDTAHSQLAAERFDIEEMKQHADTTRQIKETLFKQGTVYTDDAYRVLFQNGVNLYRVTCKGTQEQCMNKPQWYLSVEPISKEEAAAEEILAVNGILNFKERAAALAYQNSPLDKDENKPQSIVLMHVSPARTTLGEILGAAYEVHLANIFGFTQPDVAYADLIKARGDALLASLGHSRGTAIQRNALSILANDGYQNNNLSVFAFGSPITMAGFTETAVAVTGATRKEQVVFTYFTNDPIAISGGNKGNIAEAATEFFRVLTTDNSAHSCYGTGTPGCATIATPIQGGPIPENQRPDVLRIYKGGILQKTGAK